MQKFVALAVLLVLATTLASTQRIYIRHKRSIERDESQGSTGAAAGVPARESTVVFQGPNDTNPARDLPKDFEPDIAHSEKDCKDFMEFDYNPLNDSLFFNGRLPSLFHGNRDLSSFEQMFHRMLTQTSQMFNRFPMDPMMGAGSESGFPSTANYPDNYNGTVEEIVNIGGQQFRKKQHIINKSTGGSKISIMSTVYEPVNAPGGTSNSTNPESATVRDDLTDGKIITYK